MRIEIILRVVRTYTGKKLVIFDARNLGILYCDGDTVQNKYILVYGFCGCIFTGELTIFYVNVPGQGTLQF